MRKTAKTVIGLAKVDPNNPKPAIDAMMKHLEEQIAMAEVRRDIKRSAKKTKINDSRLLSPVNRFRVGG